MTLADDEGWMLWRPAAIAAALYGFEPLDERVPAFDRRAAILVDAGLVVLFDCGCAHLPTLKDHHGLTGGNKNTRVSTWHQGHRSGAVRTAPDEPVRTGRADKPVRTGRGDDSRSVRTDRGQSRSESESESESDSESGRLAPAREAARPDDDGFMLHDGRHAPVMVNGIDVENGIGRDGLDLDSFQSCFDCYEPIVDGPAMVVIENGVGGLARVHPSCPSGIAILERRRDEPDFGIEDPEHAVLTWLARAGAYVQPNGGPLHRAVMVLVKGHPGSIVIATMAILRSGDPPAQTPRQFVYGADNVLNPIPRRSSKNGTSKAGHTRSVEEIEAAFNRPPRPPKEDKEP
jgi:hypothetical protein